MHTPIQNFTLMWFDVGVAGWLVLGLLRGRKNGMSGELLLLLKWVLVVVVCSYAYAPVGAVLHQNSPVSVDWSYRIAYLGVALLISLVMNKIQTAVGEKLLGNDFFGSAEYYLGMLAGMARFACMVIFLLAFLNARIPTLNEVDHFYTQTQDLGPAQVNPLKMERQILLTSYTGCFVREHLGELLIVSTTPAIAAPKPETIAVKKQRMMDEIVGPPKP